MKTLVYRHWKGGFYVALARQVFMHDTEEAYVVYHRYGEQRLFLRPAKEFHEFIYTPEGKRVQRFRLISKP